MLSKFGNQSAQKQFIFSNKANFERGLMVMPTRSHSDFKEDESIPEHLRVHSS